MVIDTKRHLLAIDLFSGAGGFSEGLESSGIKVVLSQELHPQPGLTLAFNHPDTAVMVGDIRELKLSKMEEIISSDYPDREIDVVVGGPPCQGFSTAGKKIEGDPRNNLFKYFCKVVNHFKPKVVILENVTGFKKMYSGRIYQEAIDNFRSLGYSVEDRILNAVDYGVPQRRKRFIMVGVRNDIENNFSWPEPTHKDPETKSDLFNMKLQEHTSVLDALSDLEFIKPGFEGHSYASTGKSKYQLQRRSKNGRIFNHLATKHREKARRTFSLIKEGKTISSVPEEHRSAKRTMARLHRKHISNTVLALPDDLIHYNQNRIPTVREMARLQSFDDDFVFMGKRTSGFVERKFDVPQYTQVGNAVPPLLGKAIGLKIVDFLSASNKDIRNKRERQRRHEWLRGSSGFAGYALSSKSDITLYNIKGIEMELPIDDNQIETLILPEKINWKKGGRTGAKRQWDPGVEKAMKSRQKKY